MSEGGEPCRSKRIASRTGGDKSKPKRMKCDPSSRALTTAQSFDERLRGVVSFRAAIPVLDEYLSSIQIDDDDPGFLFDWQPNNVNQFVAAANGLNPAQAPPWLRTRPPRITAESFMDDVIDRLQPVAGRRIGWVVLAPNNVEEYGTIYGRLVILQVDDFLQAAAQMAFPVVNANAHYLGVTYLLTETRAHHARPNRLEPIAPNGQPLRQLFL